MLLTLKAALNDLDACGEAVLEAKGTNGTSLQTPAAPVASDMQQELAKFQLATQRESAFDDAIASLDMLARDQGECSFLA